MLAYNNILSKFSSSDMFLIPKVNMVSAYRVVQYHYNCPVYLLDLEEVSIFALVDLSQSRCLCLPRVHEFDCPISGRVRYWCACVRQGWVGRVSESQADMHTARDPNVSFSHYFSQIQKFTNKKNSQQFY